jgi:predicted dehydrogenase
MLENVSRRSVLAWTAVSASRVFGAAERIRLGVIGSGGRGQHLMRMANQAGGVQWVAICDAWDQRRDEAAQFANGAAVDKIADYRSLLDRKDIDGVIVATWDHLHSHIAAAACHAGKDVFVEKPMTSLPMQGHDLVRAVRSTGRVLQVGVQQRNLSQFIEAKQRFIDSGLIGDVNLVRTWWNANGGYLTPAPSGMQQKPAGLDWEACLGWLPKIPWDPKRYFNRFAYWDFSTGGQTGGLFVHMVDVVHWYLGLQAPRSAVALGGIYKYDDGRDTADTISMIVEYPKRVVVTFEATLCDMQPKESADIVFHGTGGRLHIFRGGYRFIPADAKSKDAEITAPGGPEFVHMGNWLNCIRSRKSPNANVVDGHYTAMSCHMGNMSYKEKRRVDWNKEWEV